MRLCHHVLPIIGQTDLAIIYLFAVAGKAEKKCNSSTRIDFVKSIEII
jgi:hypothetical protein